MALQLFLNITLMLFFMYCYAYIGATTIEATNRGLSDAAWPQALITIGIIFFIINIFAIIKNIPKEERNLGYFKQIDVSSFFKDKLFVGMLFMLAYSFALDYFGFITSSVAMFAAYGRLLGQKDKKKMIISSLIAVAIFYVVFGMGLGIMLPRGKGIFRTMALFIETL